MLRSLRVVPLALLLILSIALPGTVPAQSEEELSLTIIPPGQNSTLNVIEAIAYFLYGTLPPHTDDQLEMYARLSQADPGLTDSDLLDLFKPAAIGFPDSPESIIMPRPGVVITRDAFGVPQVWGLQRDDVFFGIGYVAFLLSHFLLLRAEPRGLVWVFFLMATVWAGAASRRPQVVSRWAMAGSSPMP